MPKFGVITSLDPQQPVDKIIEFAQTAERYGFDTLWVWDTWYTQDAYIALTLAALNTKRIKLAPGVAATPVRHQAMLVNTIATLDNLSGGRAIVGVGSGGQATVGRLGLPKARIAEFREHLKLLRRLTEGEEINEGKAKYRVESVRRAMPIYTAAWGPRMLQVSGEHADGVIIMGPDDPTVLSAKASRIHSAAEAVGRKAEEVNIVFGITCAYAEDPRDLIEKYKSLAVHHMQRVGYEQEYPEKFRPLFTQVRERVATIVYPEGQHPGTELVPDEFVKYSLCVGTEEEVLNRLRELLALGPDELTFSMGWVDVPHLEKLGKLVEKLRKD